MRYPLFPGIQLSINLNVAYFRNKIGDLKVTVSATPNGYADAIVLTSNDALGDASNVTKNDTSDVDDDAKFLMPHEDEMTMNQFLDIIEDPSLSPGIHYIQKQVRSKARFPVLVSRSSSMAPTPYGYFTQLACSC